MTGDPPDADDASQTRCRHGLEHLSREIARLKQVVAALVFVLWDAGNSLEEAVAAQELLANWAMQTFDPESLAASLAEFREPPAGPKVLMTGAADPPRQSQGTLFPSADTLPFPAPGDPA